MAVRVAENGKSEGRPVTGRIRIEPSIPAILSGAKASRLPDKVSQQEKATGIGIGSKANGGRESFRLMQLPVAIPADW